MALWTTDADGSRGPYRSLPGHEVFRHRPGRRRDVFLVFVLVFTISCVVGLVVRSPGGSSEHHLRAELRAVALRLGRGGHTLVVRTARGECVLLEGLRRDEVAEAERLLSRALDLPCD